METPTEYAAADEYLKTLVLAPITPPEFKRDPLEGLDDYFFADAENRAHEGTLRQWHTMAATSKIDFLTTVLPKFEPAARRRATAWIVMVEAEHGTKEGAVAAVRALWG